MLDNGLVEYFKKHADSKGRLRTKEVCGLSLSSEVKKHPYWYLDFFRCKLNGKSFYGKTLEKSHIDAEVLISQLYPQLGLRSAIYVPATESGKHFVLCNDVSGKDVVEASHFREWLKVLDRTGVNPFYLPEKVGDRNLFLQNICTNEFLRKFVEMHIFDAASYNTDRNITNFFVTLNKYGKAEDIITFDHEYSAEGALENEDKYFFRTFINLMDEDDRDELAKEDLIDYIKQNETIASVINLSETAEKLGNAKIKETAKDIKETIGYSIDKNYVSSLERSFNEVAEELVN